MKKKNCTKYFYGHRKLSCNERAPDIRESKVDQCCCNTLSTTEFKVYYIFVCDIPKNLTDQATNKTE